MSNKRRIKCKNCDTIISSKDSEEMVWCDCGNVGLRGGSDNFRMDLKEGVKKADIKVLDKNKKNGR